MYSPKAMTYALAKVIFTFIIVTFVAVLTNNLLLAIIAAVVANVVTGYVAGFRGLSLYALIIVNTLLGALINYPAVLAGNMVVALLVFIFVDYISAYSVELVLG